MDQGEATARRDVFDFQTCGFVVGMRDEARALTRQGIRAERIFCSGGRAEAVFPAASALLRDAGARSLVSFGVAGGLAPGWAPGRVALIEAATTKDGGRFAADSIGLAALVRAAARLDLGAEVVSVLGLDAPLVSAADKSAARQASGAFVVDMESHETARAAFAAGVPFLAARVVADPAERAVPPPALAGLGPDGRVRPWAVIGRLALAPRHLPALIRLAQDSRVALSVLNRCARMFSSARHV